MKAPSITSFLLVFSAITAFAQSEKELNPGYYVVVGAYSVNRENTAEKFTESLRGKGMDAKYGFNSAKNLYFVYIDFATDFKPALAEMYNARKSSEFPEAWVRIIKGNLNPETSVTQISEALVKARTESTISNGPNEDEHIASSEVSQVPEPEINPVPATTVIPPDSIEITPNAEIVQYDTMTLGNTEVFLSLFNARNNKIVEGRVKVVDTERNKLLMEVNGNDYLYLPDPSSTSGKVSLICESFGYRKVQQEINYPMPLADTVKENVELLGTTFIVYFDLMRYHIGDRVTLYNVYFFNDAAVMLPESKFELTSLLDMMKENPDYRVRLHGHTNGNYHGRIIKMGESQNFFSLDGSVNTIGSARDLSNERAQVIKDYLVANGIKADRIEVKAWGGKKPLYDKHSANARKNVRVEVEILEE